jgi:uncharacterized membrane protein
MDIVIIILEGLRVILGFFMLLFVPGFVITLVFFPRLSDIGIVERLVYSTILSIGSVIVLVLFMDVYLGVNTRPLNIFYVVGAFSYFAFFIWISELWYQDSRLKKRLESVTILGVKPRSLKNLNKKMRDSINNRLRLRP